jgi:hypothetical protein
LDRAAPASPTHLRRLGPPRPSREPARPIWPSTLQRWCAAPPPPRPLPRRACHARVQPAPYKPCHLSHVHPATSRAATPYTAPPLLEPPKLGVRTGRCSVRCPRALPDEDVASRSLEALSRTPTGHLLHLHAVGISPRVHTQAAGRRPLTAALLQNPASSLRLQRR